jgi:phage gpG-like protein
MADNALALLALDLKRTGENARRPPETLMVALGQIIAADAAQHLRDGTTPDGGSAAPLAHPRVSGNAGPPRVNRGDLLRSMEQAAVSTNLVSGNEVVVAAATPGAALQQYGGLVTAKNASGFLTIPLVTSAANTPARSYAGKLFALVRPGGDKGILAERVGSRAIKAIYALVRSVYVSARPFLGWSERVARKCDDKVLEMFGRSLFGTGGSGG